MSKRKGFDEEVDQLAFNLDLPTGAVPIDELIGTVRPEKTNKDNLREFFFGPPAEPPPPGSIEQFRKLEGRCPHCGERGRIHLSVMVCSTHGVY